MHLHTTPTQPLVQSFRKSLLPRSSFTSVSFPHIPASRTPNVSASILSLQSVPSHTQQSVPSSTLARHPRLPGSVRYGHRWWGPCAPHTGCRPTSAGKTRSSCVDARGTGAAPAATLVPAVSAWRRLSRPSACVACESQCRPWTRQPALLPPPPLHPHPPHLLRPHRPPVSAQPAKEVS